MPKTPWKAPLAQQVVKRACFEVLQKKVTFRAVWAEESNTGLGFKTGSPQQSYDDVPMSN